MKYITTSFNNAIWDVYGRSRYWYGSGKVLKYQQEPAYGYMVSYVDKLPDYFLEAEFMRMQEKGPAATREYLHLFHKTEGPIQAEKKSWEDFTGLERFFFRPLAVDSVDYKKVGKKKSDKWSFGLIEVKTNGDCFEFFIRKTVTCTIVDWEDLPDVDIVRQYLRKHPFPGDKLYSEKEFLNDVDGSGYVHLWVEKRETAEFICDLICELA